MYEKGKVNMKIYLDTNVYEEALNRVRRIFDEFPDIYVSVSGGKDSTIIWNLAMIVAKEKNRLPLKTVFLDQEAEYENTIKHIKEIMYHEDVEPYWLQVPIILFNATSATEEWLECWNPEDKKNWMRPKDPIAMTENIWGTDRFVDFFRHFMAKETELSEHGRTAMLTGMRAEESPRRMLGMINALTYKDITWGVKNQYNKNTFQFHPIYDWSYRDVWKAINDNGWSYNKIYDYQYQHGVGINQMRVSNLHHETAVGNLFYLQEVEPNTFQKLTERLAGVNTAGQLGTDDYFVRELPYMFKDWFEYRDYLLDKLIKDEHKPTFAKIFARTQARYAHIVGEEKIGKTHVQSLLANDYHGTKIDDAESMWRLEEKNHKRRVANELAQREIDGSGE